MLPTTQKKHQVLIRTVESIYFGPDIDVKSRIGAQHSYAMERDKEVSYKMGMLISPV